MTDEEKVALVRLLIGDSESSPFYPLYSDCEYLQFLTYANGDINKTIRLAAISASMMLAGYSSRERTGDIEVWSELSKNYLAALRLMITDSNAVIPDNLMPWSHAVSTGDLTRITACDTPCHTFEWQRSSCPTRQCTSAPCSCGG